MLHSPSKHVKSGPYCCRTQGCHGVQQSFARVRFNILGTSSHLFWTSGREGCERSRLSWISQKCLHLFLNFECEVNVKLAVQLVVFLLAPAPETEICRGLPPTPAPSPAQSRARVAAISNARWQAGSCLPPSTGSTWPPDFGLASVPNSL